MGFIFCPECGSKISDLAKVCPHCGYTGEVELIPISQLDRSITNKRVNIPSIDVFGDGTNLLSIKDNNVLYAFLSNINNLSRYAPNIYNIVKQWAGGDTVLVADISKKAKELIDEGILTLNIDKKTGEFLPTLRDLKTGKIFEQVRLKEQILPGDVCSAILNLQQQAMMKSILDEIEQLSQSVEEIQLEMMDDRLAEAEAVWLELEQATKIQDTQLRNYKVLSLQSEATRSRVKLEKNFIRNIQCLSKEKIKIDVKSKSAERALNELSIISTMAKIEYVSYHILGEQEAGLHALEQYQYFIEMNHLNRRNTLVLINEYTKNDAQAAIDDFLIISKDLKKFQLQLTSQKHELIGDGEDG